MTNDIIKNRNGLGGIFYTKSTTQNKMSTIFEEALINWINNIKKYTNEFDPTDCLYYYNERATLSTFAASLYKSGYFILEEFSSSKHHINGKGDETYGRVDLYFGCEENPKGYIVEAKQTDISIGSKTYSLSKIFKSLAEACIDVEYSFGPLKDYVDKGFAVSFIVPYIKGNQSQDDIKKMSEQFIKNLKMNFKNTNNILEKWKYKEYKNKKHEDIDTDFEIMAYSFPKRSVSYEYANGNYNFPGVICLIKELVNEK